MKITLQSKKMKANHWINGLRWKLEFGVWGFYICEVWESATEEYDADYCDWYGNTRKEYKQHLKEHHVK